VASSPCLRSRARWTIARRLLLRTFAFPSKCNLLYFLLNPSLLSSIPGLPLHCHLASHKSPRAAATRIPLPSSPTHHHHLLPLQSHLTLKGQSPQPKSHHHRQCLKIPLLMSTLFQKLFNIPNLNTSPQRLRGSPSHISNEWLQGIFKTSSTTTMLRSFRSAKQYAAIHWDPAMEQQFQTPFSSTSGHVFQLPFFKSTSLRYGRGSAGVRANALRHSLPAEFPLWDISSAIIDFFRSAVSRADRLGLQIFDALLSQFQHQII
jgi:hypothetical protein